MKNLLIKRSIYLLILLTSIVSCKSTKTENPVGINTTLMDKTVNPADDFFRYVNGKWVDNTEIPADRTRWGSFDELRKNTDDDVMIILNEAISDKNIDPKSDQAKAIALYKTILDTIQRDKLGIKPIQPYLDKINSVKNTNDIVRLTTYYNAEANFGFFGAYVGADAKNSNRNVVYVGTGSLGLPDRDYYVSDSPDSKEKREKYVKHVEKMLQYINISPEEAAKQAATILNIETKMATSMLDRVERRDRRKTYNPMKVSELDKLSPSLKWNNYLCKIKLIIKKFNTNFSFISFVFEI